MFGFYTASSPVAGQVLELSYKEKEGFGYIVLGTAFVQPGGVLGAYSPVDDDVFYKGEVFETETEALQCALNHDLISSGLQKLLIL